MPLEQLENVLNNLNLQVISQPGDGYLALINGEGPQNINVQISAPLPFDLSDDFIVDENITIEFTSKRILNFDLNPNGSPKICTGINILDSVLYFTDGRNEPKKIDIEKGLVGSGETSQGSFVNYTPFVNTLSGFGGGDNPSITGLKHLIPTRLVIKDSDASNEGYTPGYLDKGVFRESNATVIRPNPEEPPFLNMEGYGVTNSGNTGVALLPFALPKSMLPGDKITVLCMEAPYSRANYSNGANNPVIPQVGSDLIGWSNITEEKFNWGTAYFYDEMAGGSAFADDLDATFEDLAIYNLENPLEAISWGATNYGSAYENPRWYDLIRHASVTWQGRLIAGGGVGAQLQGHDQAQNHQSADDLYAPLNDYNHLYAPNFTNGVGPWSIHSQTFHGYYEPYVVEGYETVNLVPTGLPHPNFNTLKPGDVLEMSGLSNSINVSYSPDAEDGSGASALGVGSSQKYPHLFSTSVSPDAPSGSDLHLNNVCPPEETLNDVPFPNQVLVKVEEVKQGWMDFNPYNGQELPYGQKAEPCTELTLSLVSQTAEYNNNGHLGWWLLNKVNNITMKDFGDSFLSFSYRYRYDDGQYSGLAPFSRPAFRSNADNGGLADRRNYSPAMWQAGYTLANADGVYVAGDPIVPYQARKNYRNEVTSLSIQDWVPKNIPRDVIEVELFVKDSESPNVYSVDSLNYKSPQWQTISTGGNKGSYEVISTTFKNALDSNQLLRPFDNVPKMALAQEIVANRLIYGNYVVDYDLVDANGNDINVDFTTSVRPYQTSALVDNSEATSYGSVLPTWEEFLIGRNHGKPRESVKSIRTYQVGIVYRDDYGRETPVLTCEGSSISVPKASASTNSRISVTIKSLPPHWATSYKIFVKDPYDAFSSMHAQSYEFLAPTDGDEAEVWFDDAVQYSTWSGGYQDNGTPWAEEAKIKLNFNGSHINDAIAGDIITQKTKYGASPIDTTPNSWALLGQPTNPDLNYEVLETNVVNGAITAPSGNFKCTVKADFPLIKNSGRKFNDSTSLLEWTEIHGSQQLLAANFETVPVQRIDSDLYYEASQAYPIHLTSKTDEQHIKVGRLVNFSAIGPSGENLTTSYGASWGSIDSTDYPWLDVDGLATFSSEHVTTDGVIQNDVNPNYKNKWEVRTVETKGDNDSMYEFTKITLVDRFTGELYSLESDNILQTPNLEFVVLKFIEDSDVVSGKGQAVELRVKEFLENGEILLYKQTCPTTLFPSNQLTVTVPWFNCYSWGDGREVMKLFENIQSPKLDKGVKASTTVSDYAEKKVTSGLIYSGMINKFSGLNNLNQFISFLGITKELNPKHGSIQKLHARETNLIALCENKILNILAEKDVLYNADSTTNLAAINQVLGTAVAYEGEYGISQNPESFTSHTYRSYFTDKARGAVLRLSKDGLTPISEAGMSNYFKKELRANSGNIVGGYNKDKDEYELTIGDKNVVFDETIDGWVSFRSYLNSTQPVSIDRFYYTFNDGKMWEQDADSMEDQRCEFFGEQYKSSVTTTFNQSADIVKTFKTLSLEGSDARAKFISFPNTQYNLNSPLGAVAQSDVGIDEASAGRGWYVDYLQTDMEKGTVNSFVRREGKEFGYIQGVLSDGVGQLKLATAQGLGTPNMSGGDGAYGTDISYFTSSDNVNYNNTIVIRGALNECISIGDDVFKIATFPNSYASVGNTSAAYPEEDYGMGGVTQPKLIGVISDITQGVDEDGEYYSISLSQSYTEGAMTLADVFPSFNQEEFENQWTSPFGGAPVSLYAQTKSVNVGDIIGYYCDVKLSNNSLTRAELFSIGAGVQISSK